MEYLIYIAALAMLGIMFLSILSMGWRRPTKKDHPLDFETWWESQETVCDDPKTMARSGWFAAMMAMDKHK